MYVDVSVISRNGKTYKRVLLRQSYRKNGRTYKRTISNITSCTDEEIAAIKLALEHKCDLAKLGSISESLTLQQGQSVGAVWLVREIACQLGISRALGNSRQGKQALWQVIARVIDQGSRLSAVRFAKNHAACDLLNTETFNKEHLYFNLDWLHDQQVAIEKKLFYYRYKKNKVDLFLYDVTSSYLEGVKNELAAFGYNGDGKRGKRQIVIGLLCDSGGSPLSIEVVKGNTQDSKTFGSQISKVADRFGGGSVTFVGDRGMIKGPRIEELKSYQEHEFHYITAIKRAQIDKLIKTEVFQIGMFDHDIAEVDGGGGIRYIIRRNPIRAKEIEQSRADRYATLLKLVEIKNHYLQEHPRAKVYVAEGDIMAKSRKLKIQDWTILSAENRSLNISKNIIKLQEKEQLDGCYALKTDLEAHQAAKEIVHARYKDLALVEWAFRTSKTVQLEMRPINVRLESRTRGHAFVVMLAYLIVKELASRWASFNVTVEEGLHELDALCTTEVSIDGGPAFHRIPKARELSQQLLDAANVQLPPVLPSKGIVADPKKKVAG